MTDRPKQADPTVASIVIRHSWDTHLGIRPGYDHGSSTLDPEVTNVLLQIAEIASVLGCDHRRSAEQHKVSGHHFDGGITTHWIEIVTIFATAATTLAALLQQIKPLLIELIRKEAQKGIRIKVGDVEVHLQGTDDIDKALTLLDRARDAGTPRIIAPGEK